MELINTLVSCLPLVIISGVVILLSWKSRGRIENIKIGANGFEIQFGKCGRCK